MRSVMDTPAAADRLELAIIRGLLAADVTSPLERAAALAALRLRLDRHIDREVHVALETGASFAAVARKLGCSRQAVRQRVARRASAATAADGGGSTVRGASP
jgi:ActR/RegA family two-component response regulator